MHVLMCYTKQRMTAAHRRERLRWQLLLVRLQAAQHPQQVHGPPRPAHLFSITNFLFFSPFLRCNKICFHGYYLEVIALIL